MRGIIREMSPYLFEYRHLFGGYGLIGVSTNVRSSCICVRVLFLVLTQFP